MIYSPYFILYFIPPIIYLGSGTRSLDLPSVVSLPDYTGFSSLSAAHHSAEAVFAGPVGTRLAADDPEMLLEV